MTASRQSIFRKCCAAALSASLAMQPLVGYAAPIMGSVLSETPLQGLNPVKPNILFTLDDSGSMGWDYLPEYTVARQEDSNFVPTGVVYCRDKLPCGGFDNHPPVGSLPLPGTFTPYRQIDPPIRSSDFNKLYYNPTVTYNPAKRDDGTPLPCESTNTGCTGPWSAVYMDGFAGFPGTNTSNSTINLAPTSTSGCVSGTTTALCVPVSTPSDNGPWPGVPDTLWCRSTSSPLTGADYLTADGDGSVCRRNGRAYPKTTIGTVTTPAIAAGYNYPNTVGTTCAAGEACLFTTSVTAYGYPFYYTIAKVWFCDSNSGGFGTGTCGTRQDSVTFKYVRYSASTSTGPAFDPTAFTRVDIRPASAGGVLVNGVAATGLPSGRTYNAEMANFAKWYAFYRTRMLAMKTAGGFAFSALTEEQARVGFATLWENASLFLNVAPFDSTQKGNWFNRFYASAAQNNTPLPDAVWAAGEYFSGHNPTVYPGAVDPLDPTTGQCQRNYHLLSTDGYWGIPLGSSTGIGVPSGTAVGDTDKIVPTLPVPVPGLTPGSLFPAPYYEGSQTSGNSLADLAMFYWANDIRTNLDNKVQDTVAPWQHVTLFGVSIGTEGTIVFPTGIDPIRAGTQDWPKPTGTGGPDSIDDLWHAALNSRGDYFNARDPQELAASIIQVLNQATAQSGTGTAVGIAGAQFSVNKNFGYRTSYETGWWGDVRKYALDPSTGALPIDTAGNPLNPALWSAASQLDTQAAATGWNTNRRIVTINDATNTVVAFHDATQLSAAQQASLVAGWQVVTPTPSAQAVLNYLRGDPSNEGVGLTNFRKRAHVLGDIVYSGAVPVGAPSQPYDDIGNPGYTTFKSTKSTRTAMLYVGANDGMLHAFVDSTTADAGKEAWAYIPKAMFTGGDPNDTAHAPSHHFQIGALSYGFSGDPLFAHKFYVNATPRVWDIDILNTNTSTPPTGNDWRTLLVGGLGAGGRAIYALDVTTPVALTDSEATIASSGRVLWEFTDQNLGYVYDAPTLVKTLRYGWVALVVSGYNNTGGNKPGQGILYALNPKDGTILKQLSTGVGSLSDPSGLSTIRAFTPSRKNPYVLQAYGGDLKGNVWRFDLSDPDDSKWKVELIATLTDAQSNPQPITTGVRIEIDQNNNVDRYIFVGTGKLLGKDDIADATVGNTLYVIRDGTVTTPDPAPTAPYSRAVLNSVDGTKVTGFNGAATGRGWFQDGAAKSWKIGTDVFADVQTVVYAFSRPATDPCAPPLSSTLFARDLLTGNSVLQSEGGTVVSGIDIGAGIAGVALIQSEAGASSSVSSGDVRVQVTTMAGQVFSFGVNLAGAGNLKHRVSWRLLNRE